MIAQYVCRYALWCISPWLCVFVGCRSLGLQLTFFSLWFIGFVQSSRWKSNCVLVFIATVFYWLRGFALLRPCFFGFSCQEQWQNGANSLPTEQHESHLCGDTVSEEVAYYFDSTVGGLWRRVCFCIFLRWGRWFCFWSAWKMWIYICNDQCWAGWLVQCGECDYYLTLWFYGTPWTWWISNFVW